MLEATVTWLTRNLRNSLKKSDNSEKFECSWSWVCQHLLEYFASFPCGITPAIVLTELNLLLLTSSSSFKNSTTSSLKPWKDQLSESPPTLSHLSIISCHIAWCTHGSSNNITKVGWVEKSSVEMYSHLKFSLFDKTLYRSKRHLSLTGCRINVCRKRKIKGNKHAVITVLPTDFIVFTLDEMDLNSPNEFTTGWSTTTLRHCDDLQKVWFIVDSVVKPQLPTTTSSIVYLSLYCHNTTTTTTPTLAENIYTQSVSQKIKMVLADDQVPLGTLFSEGFVLGLYNPKVVSKEEVAYSTNTICFTATRDIVSQTSKQDHQSLPSAPPLQVVPASPLSYRDMQHFANELKPKDLAPNDFNVSLYGQVVSVTKIRSDANNSWLLKSSLETSPIEDNTLTYVTIKTNSGIAAVVELYQSHNMILVTGNFVFLTGVIVLDEKNNFWRCVCHKDIKSVLLSHCNSIASCVYNGRVTVVNNIPGLVLQSSFPFARPVPLDNSNTAWVSRVLITSGTWKSDDDDDGQTNDALDWVHITCNTVLRQKTDNNNIVYCPYCKVAFTDCGDGRYQYKELCLNLDDGVSKVKKVVVRSQSVILELLDHINCTDFNRLSTCEKKEIFSRRLIFKEYYMLLSKSGGAIVVDQVAAIDSNFNDELIRRF